MLIPKYINQAEKIVIMDVFGEERCPFDSKVPLLHIGIRQRHLECKQLADVPAQLAFRLVGYFTDGHREMLEGLTNVEKPR